MRSGKICLGSDGSKNLGSQIGPPGVRSPPRARSPTRSSLKAHCGPKPQQGPSEAYSQLGTYGVRVHLSTREEDEAQTKCMPLGRTHTVRTRLKSRRDTRIHLGNRRAQQISKKGSSPPVVRLNHSLHTVIMLPYCATTTLCYQPVTGHDTQG